MVFTKRLREGVRRGEITCSVRIWTQPHVRVGGRYRMDEGEIEIDSIETIGFPDITPELARASGFLGVIDLLKVAQAWPRGKHLSDPLPLPAAGPDEGQDKEGGGESESVIRQKGPRGASGNLI